jgi:hypothetical protein
MSTMEARGQHGQHAPAGAAAITETIMQRLELGSPLRGSPGART